MSNQRRLPQEMCDHIIDLFYDDPETLKRCSLVSKSWVTRTQNHLFSDIALTPVNYPKWRKTFPDSTNSPACHTRVLTVDGILRDAGDVGWIQNFSCVERLIVIDHRRGAAGPDGGVPYLVPFYRLAHSLKSLRVHDILFPHPEFFNLICSLPLLEDLAINFCETYNTSDRWDATRLPTPTPSPALTGTLDLRALINLGGVPRFLLGLRGGLRFRKIKILCFGGGWDPTPVEELVAACSDTLEYFDVSSEPMVRLVLFLCQASR